MTAVFASMWPIISTSPEVIWTSRFVRVIYVCFWVLLMTGPIHDTLISDSSFPPWLLHIHQSGAETRSADPFSRGHFLWNKPSETCLARGSCGRRIKARLGPIVHTQPLSVTGAQNHNAPFSVLRDTHKSSRPMGLPSCSAGPLLTHMGTQRRNDSFRGTCRTHPSV